MKKIIFLFIFVLKIYAQKLGSDEVLKIKDYLNPKKGSFWTEGSQDYIIDYLLNHMKEEDILSQVFLFGWNDNKLPDKLLKWIKDKNLGGINIFSWNAKNLNNLKRNISVLQNTALNTPWGIPIFVATDQEGGWINHIEYATLDTPGNMAIGSSGLAYDAYYTALYIAQELRNLGINTNLSLTVDIYTNLKSEIIGPRSFSSNPNQVSFLSTAYFKGFETSYLITSAKHFPGYGQVNQNDLTFDSIPKVDIDLYTLKNRELLPYKTLIKEDIPMIMVGNLIYNKIDDKLIALSRIFLHDILREELHYDGILISDDLNMQSINKYKKNENYDDFKFIRDILANEIDIIFMSNMNDNFDEVFLKLVKEYKTNQIFKNKINLSVKRILKLKLKYIKNDNRVPLDPFLSTLDSDQIPSNEAKLFFQEQALRAVTLIKSKTLPYKNYLEDKILILSQSETFLKIAKDYFKGDIFQFSETPRHEALDSEILKELLNKINNYDKIIFNLLNPRSLDLLKKLKNIKDKIIVISSLNPAYLDSIPWVNDAIAIYGYSSNEFKAGLNVITGAFDARGKLPIKIWNNLTIKETL